MVVERCLAEGLVGGEGFAVDASLIALMLTSSALSSARTGVHPRILASRSGSIWSASTTLAAHFRANVSFGWRAITGAKA
jgi:hypothetical protein